MSFAQLLVGQQKPVYIFVIFIGLAFIGLGIFALRQDLDMQANGKIVNGTVIDFTSSMSDKHHLMYYPVISFMTAEGLTITYYSKSGSSSPSLKLNDKVEILYDPRYPENAEVNRSSMWIVPLVFVSVGLFIVSLMAFFGYIYYREIGLSDRLKKSGVKVMAKFSCVQPGLVFVNGKPTYYAVCTYEKDGKVYKFNSSELQYDPTNALKDKEIPVYVNPDGMREYSVDLSLILK